MSAHVDATAPRGLIDTSASAEQAGVIAKIGVHVARYAYHVWSQTSSDRGEITPVMAQVLALMADPDTDVTTRRQSLEHAVSHVWREAVDYMTANGGKPPLWSEILAGR